MESLGTFIRVCLKSHEIFSQKSFENGDTNLNHTKMGSKNVVVCKKRGSIRWISTSKRGVYIGPCIPTSKRGVYWTEHTYPMAITMEYPPTPPPPPARPPSGWELGWYLETCGENNLFWHGKPYQRISWYISDSNILKCTNSFSILLLSGLIKLGLILLCIGILYTVSYEYSNNMTWYNVIISPNEVFGDIMVLASPPPPPPPPPRPRPPRRREHSNSKSIQPISFKFYMRVDTPLRFFAIEIWYPPRTRTTAFAAKWHLYPPNLQNAISP